MKEAELNRKYFMTTGICFLVLNFYMFLRFRWGMFDIYCPTFILNLLGKVSQYGGIVDHVGIPEIPFNYHYLPALIASVFVNLGFSKLLSLYFAIIIGFNFTFLMINASSCGINFKSSPSFQPNLSNKSSGKRKYN